ncbi:hypothetical protein LSH36_849g00013 [Paralvinella palmiformis]|uniref:receptor protein-tyrosine kinase n=1 Tax=Paralvinella palmiformis TaxID=53620 RepID=A0AAD9IZS4_9ANNE|nr:hypothetical protein LSH36_849g00013 [Paralvinella palmiformis]
MGDFVSALPSTFRCHISQLTSTLEHTPSAAQKATRKYNGFQFKTCTNSGRIGPTQYQCDRAYEFTDINVTVQLEPPYAGVQVWTVPKTALYSITALGASGGKGLDNTDISRGGYVSGKFNLTEGEEIYMLIGQRGQSACEETNDATKPLCLYGLQSHSKEYSDGGGGGGGGGTFVFKWRRQRQLTCAATQNVVSREINPWKSFDLLRSSNLQPLAPSAGCLTTRPPELASDLSSDALPVIPPRRPVCFGRSGRTIYSHTSPNGETQKGRRAVNVNCWSFVSELSFFFIFFSHPSLVEYTSRSAVTVNDIVLGR